MRPGRARRSEPHPVEESDSPDAAYAQAVKRLARQPQSRAALGAKLARAGFSTDAIGAALDRAEADGYLNDREYAASLVRRRARSRGHALIAQELRARGIDEAAAEPALAQVDPEAELEQALTIGRRLLAQKHPADAEALLSYLAPRLARRGFSSGLAYRICRRLADELEAARLFDATTEHN
ncbi:MAG TPA: regulatory protein RecX [Candidatus Dormibacteraeota bacterium]|nr:regulatory protein RecX [Candidatus Dormibacteraeota bacterium]